MKEIKINEMNDYDLFKIREWKVQIKCHWKDGPVDTVGLKLMEKRHSAIYYRTFDGDGSLFNDIRRNWMKKVDTKDNWMFVYTYPEDQIKHNLRLSYFSCNFIDYGIRDHGVYGLMLAMISIVDGVYHIFDMFPEENLFDWIEVSFAPFDRGYYNFGSKYALSSMLFDRRK